MHVVCMRSGKALLFHYACSLASRGQSVVLLSHKATLEQSPPLLPQSLRAVDALLNNIHLRQALPSLLHGIQQSKLEDGSTCTDCGCRYLDGLDDVQKYAACFHLLTPRPAALLIDGLFAESFLSPRCAVQFKRHHIPVSACCFRSGASTRQQAGASCTASHTRTAMNIVAAMAIVHLRVLPAKFQSVQRQGACAVSWFQRFS